MEQSTDISKLAEALAAAQAQMMGAKKDSKNPFFKSEYADLKSVTDAIKEPLNSNGLSWAQLPGNNDKGWPSVTTILMHKSGQFIKSSFALEPKKNDPQAVGSAITYARRYSLAAICGVYQTDDDAEGSMDRQKKSGGNSGKKDFPRYGSKNLDPRPAGVHKRPHPSQLKKSATVGELMERALKDFPNVNETLILEADDFAVSDSGEAGLEAKDAHKWQDLAVHKARDIGITVLNPNDQAFAFLAKRLQKARADQEPKGEDKAAQRRGQHKAVQKQLIEG